MIRCDELPGSRRRNFWTTQPDACGVEAGPCDTECGRPGLLLTSADCSENRCECCPDATTSAECLSNKRLPASQVPRSIVTTQWLRSLIINILYTDGKLPDTKCGFVPGTQGGHWSESYRQDGIPVGSLVRNIGTRTSFRDAVKSIKAQLEADLARLITMKLVHTLVVTVEHIGGTRVQANIEVTGGSGEQTRVGLLGERLANTWAWT